MTAGMAATRPRREASIAADGRRARAWLLLVGALAIHVIDEALTGFLQFYNPLVLSIRSRLEWFPMPTFSFAAWLGGLIAFIVVLVSLTPIVRRGGVVIRVLSTVFAALMFLNGLGHLGGSVYFGRWLPGATSAPLLLAASVLFIRATLKPPRRA
jgi:hypothetical protein